MGQPPLMPQQANPWADFLSLDIISMTEKDLPEVAALEASVQYSPWQYTHFSDSLKNGHSAWVLRQAGITLGFIVLMTIIDEAHILNFAIAPAHQRQGLGTRLLRYGMVWAAQNGMDNMYLEVRASNEKAIALYRHLGFIEVGRRKDYYPAPDGREDGLVFIRPLENILPAT